MDNNQTVPIEQYNTLKKEYNKILKKLNSIIKINDKQFNSKIEELEASNIDLKRLNTILKQGDKEAKKVLTERYNLEDEVMDEIEKNRQQQLLMLHQSRLAQMGEMISMIAHQWRQPLNSLAMLNQAIIIKYKRDKLDDDNIEYFKENSNNQIQNMSKTIDDFRDFFKPEKEKVEFIINDVVSDAIDMVKPIFENNKIDIIFENKNKYKTLGFPNELGQTILNIINNAKDALVENKICDKSDSTSCHKNKQIKITLKEEKIAVENSNFQTITLTISDNAGGIPQNIIDKIFDPYFSTKEEKDGTGLGLYMAKLIIEDHMGGKLSVSNDIIINQDGKPSGGAVFKINLKEEW